MNQFNTDTKSHFVDRNLKYCTKPKQNLHFLENQTMLTILRTNQLIGEEPSVETKSNSVIKKFPTFYRTITFINMFTSLHLVSYPEQNKSSPYPRTLLHKIQFNIIIQYTHPSCNFSPCITKILYVFSTWPYCMSDPINLLATDFFSNFSTPCI